MPRQSSYTLMSWHQPEGALCRDHAHLRPLIIPSTYPRLDPRSACRTILRSARPGCWSVPARHRRNRSGAGSMARRSPATAPGRSSLTGCSAPHGCRGGKRADIEQQVQRFSSPVDGCGSGYGPCPTASWPGLGRGWRAGGQGSSATPRARWRCGRCAGWHRGCSTRVNRRLRPGAAARHRWRVC